MLQGINFAWRICHIALTALFSVKPFKIAVKTRVSMREWINIISRFFVYGILYGNGNMKHIA